MIGRGHRTVNVVHSHIDRINGRATIPRSRRYESNWVSPSRRARPAHVELLPTVRLSSSKTLDVLPSDTHPSNEFNGSAK